jgi:hypothetical protein
MTAWPSDQPLEGESGPSLVDETARALTGYYGRLGRIAVDLGQVLLPVEVISLDLSPLFRLFRREPGDAESAPSPLPSADVSGSPTLLVEAAGDTPGFGVFVVENQTAAPVSAPITVSPFVSDEGHEVRPRLLLRPAVVTLEPGQQAMVQLAAELDEALEPGVRYRGEIAIPALSDRRIAIVLRRVATDAAPVIDSPTAEPTTEPASPTEEPSTQPRSRAARKPARTRKTPEASSSAAEDSASSPKPRRRRPAAKANPAQ